jgi:hypothetical protein
MSVLKKCDICGKIDKVHWYAYRDVCKHCDATLNPKHVKYTLEHVKEIFKRSFTLNISNVSSLLTSKLENVLKPLNAGIKAKGLSSFFKYSRKAVVSRKHSSSKILEHESHILNRWL